MTDRFSADDAPVHWDAAHCVDAYGFHNCIAIAYWNNVEAFDRWRTSSGFAQWWDAPERASGEVGLVHGSGLPQRRPLRDRFFLARQSRGSGAPRRTHE
ncbi:phenylacetaldoxime dehydratase family protein [Pseudomonas brassicacearum]|uniref:phenylacetaldoxime dehydratase family protein n=1 Tax=Pseudomonas brassicacearum TaxID=930166 RepID=UPI0021821FCC|nr:phenylacetaldoxime dehydratase family protein [Pseudomonas brassicacearum]